MKFHAGFPNLRSSGPLRTRAGLVPALSRPLRASWVRATTTRTIGRGLDAILRVSSGVQVRCAAQDTSSALSTVGDRQELVTFRFIVPEYVTWIGQELIVVGSVPELGSWSVTNAPCMKWNEGHKWVLEVQLPKKSFEFKVVIADGDNVRWENNVNRYVQVGDPNSGFPVDIFVQVQCWFDYTDTTSLELVVPKSRIQGAVEMSKAILELLKNRQSKALEQSKAPKEPETSSTKRVGLQSVVLQRLREAVEAQSAAYEEVSDLMKANKIDLNKEEEGTAFIPISKVELPAALSDGTTAASLVTYSLSAGDGAAQPAGSSIAAGSELVNGSGPEREAHSQLLSVLKALRNFFDKYPSLGESGRALDKLQVNALASLLGQAVEVAGDERLFAASSSPDVASDMSELLMLTKYGQARLAKEVEELKAMKALGTDLSSILDSTARAEDATPEPSSSSTAPASGAVEAPSKQPSPPLPIKIAASTRPPVPAAATPTASKPPAAAAATPTAPKPPAAAEVAPAMAPTAPKPLGAAAAPPTVSKPPVAAAASPTPSRPSSAAPAPPTAPKSPAAASAPHSALKPPAASQAAPAVSPTPVEPPSASAAPPTAPKPPAAAQVAPAVSPTPVEPPAAAVAPPTASRPAAEAPTAPPIASKPPAAAHAPPTASKPLAAAQAAPVVSPKPVEPAVEAPTASKTASDGATVLPSLPEEPSPASHQNPAPYSSVTEASRSSTPSSSDPPSSATSSSTAQATPSSSPSASSPTPGIIPSSRRKADSLSAPSVSVPPAAAKAASASVPSVPSFPTVVPPPTPAPNATQPTKPSPQPRPSTPAPAARPPPSSVTALPLPPPVVASPSAAATVSSSSISSSTPQPPQITPPSSKAISDATPAVSSLVASKQQAASTAPVPPPEEPKASANDVQPTSQDTPEVRVQAGAVPSASPGQQPVMDTIRQAVSSSDLKTKAAAKMDPSSTVASSADPKTQAATSIEPKSTTASRTGPSSSATGSASQEVMSNKATSSPPSPREETPLLRSKFSSSVKKPEYMEEEEVAADRALCAPVRPVFSPRSPPPAPVGSAAAIEIEKAVKSVRREVTRALKGVSSPKEPTPSPKPAFAVLPKGLSPEEKLAASKAMLKETMLLRDAVSMVMTGSAAGSYSPVVNRADSASQGGSSASASSKGSKSTISVPS